MGSSLKRKNYRGDKCKVCGVEIITGSKTGVCKKHNNKKSGLLALDNGRTLCVICHRTTDTYGGKSRICN